MKWAIMLAIGAFAMPQTSQSAEIILDDFSETERLDYPNIRIWQYGLSRVQLGADVARSVLMFDQRKGGSTTGYIDIGMEIPSVLVSELSSIPPLSSGYPDSMTAVVDTYFEGRADLTDGGTNDTIYYDFAFFEGPTPPRTIRLHAFTDTAWSITYLRDVPISSEPFTIAVPFAEFRDRVGRDIRPNFTNVSSLSFEAFTGGFWDFEEDEGWRFGLDEIRVGPAVPEPRHVIGVCLMIVFVIAVHRRRRNDDSRGITFAC
jgi:hypothetical protein